MRFHDKFSPKGTNVDFVEVLEQEVIKIRTYERGVEAETLACGTGVVASAIMASFKLGAGSGRYKYEVITKSGEIVNVYFNVNSDSISDICFCNSRKCFSSGVYKVYAGVYFHPFSTRILFC